MLSRTQSDVQTPRAGDRFIPFRASAMKDVAHFNLMSENSTDSMDVESSPAKAYQRSVAQSLFGQEERVEEHKILALKSKAPAPRAGHQNQMAVLYSQSLSKVKKDAKTVRTIPTTCERVLDAPGLSEDYYLNLIDWGANNLVAVALGQTPPSSLKLVLLVVSSLIADRLFCVHLERGVKRNQ